MSDCVRRERQLQHYWWRLLALNENVNPGSAQEKWGPPCTPPASLFAKITWPVSWSGGGDKIRKKKGKKKLTWHWCFVSVWLEGSHWSFTGSLFAPSCSAVMHHYCCCFSPMHWGCTLTVRCSNAKSTQCLVAPSAQQGWGEGFVRFLLSHHIQYSSV